MEDHRLTHRVIKFAFIFLGSVGTILFLRWVVVPMLPLAPAHPSLLYKSFNFGLGLFAFALIIAAIVSGIVLVSGLWGRSKG
jgi:hypothetical protein